MMLTDQEHEEFSAAFREIMAKLEGVYEAEGVHVEFSGTCPIQGYGTIDGYACYYRSRGEGWQFEVYAQSELGEGPLPDPIWEYTEDPYIWPEGGWVEADVSCSCIKRAVGMYRRESLEPE